MIDDLFYVCFDWTGSRFVHMRLEEMEIKYKGRRSVGDGEAVGGCLDFKKKERKSKSVNVREGRFTPTC